MVLFLMMGFCSFLHGGSVYVEYEGDKVILFESKDASYRDLHKFISSFTGSEDRIASSPVEGITVKIHDTWWSELMLFLFDDKRYRITKGLNGGIVVKCREMQRKGSTETSIRSEDDKMQSTTIESTTTPASQD